VNSFTLPPPRREGGRSPGAIRGVTKGGAKQGHPS